MKLSELALVMIRLQAVALAAFTVTGGDFASGSIGHGFVSLLGAGIVGLALATLLWRLAPKLAGLISSNGEGEVIVGPLGIEALARLGMAFLGLQTLLSAVPQALVSFSALLFILLGGGKEEWKSLPGVGSALIVALLMIPIGYLLFAKTDGLVRLLTKRAPGSGFSRKTEQ